MSRTISSELNVKALDQHQEGHADSTQASSQMLNEVNSMKTPMTSSPPENQHDMHPAVSEMLNNFSLDLPLGQPQMSPNQNANPFDTSSDSLPPIPAAPSQYEANDQQPPSCPISKPSTSPDIAWNSADGDDQ